MSGASSLAQSPIITVDGPGGTGKGTVSRLAAQKLNFHFLDSGALYRLLGLAGRQSGISLNDGAALSVLALKLDIVFLTAENSEEGRVLLDGEDVTDAMRTEAAGSDASVIAVIPAVRAALLERQRGFAQMPGLVADGRDMGTVVFPHASLKIFLTASVEERARRRYNQLINKGLDADQAALIHELNVRDERDRQRAVAPLMPAADAILIDTTSLRIDEVVAQVLRYWASKSSAK